MLQLENICKDFPLKNQTVHALKNINFNVQENEFIAIMGSSGSGKSTLLNILGCLDLASSGTYLLDGRDITSLDDDTLSETRSEKLGFIFQSFNLLPQLTVLENIQLPLLYQKKSAKDHTEKAIELANSVGLGDRLEHKPNQLSGGQQQRVAIARSLINDPLIILADEPTGNLDSSTEKEIMTVLDNLHQKGKTIIMVTHDTSVSLYAKRIIQMKDGVILTDEPVGAAPQAS